jgi:hypothetical protein
MTKPKVQKDAGAKPGADTDGKMPRKEEQALHPTQAMGDGRHKNMPDGTNTPRDTAGESGRGDYPNPTQERKSGARRPTGRVDSLSSATTAQFSSETSS